MRKVRRYGPCAGEAVVGAEVRAERERQGISLRDAARQLDMSPAHLSNIERGRMSLGGPAGRRAIARFAPTERR